MKKCLFNALLICRKGILFKIPRPRIIYDGVPVVITGEYVYDRHQGTDSHAADEKTKLASSKNFRYKFF